MVANLSNISLNEGYGKSGQIRGIYGDYTIIEFDTPIRSEEKFALYNLKTKELKKNKRKLKLLWLNWKNKDVIILLIH